jgi:5-methylcytosine-specific restriction endonuclease McrA
MRRRSHTVKACRRCRQDLSKHGMSVRHLARRDGSACGICAAPVDLTLKAPHPGAPSVDHIFPRARGGDSDPKNLQLAHLRCNILKRDHVLEELLPA